MRKLIIGAMTGVVVGALGFWVIMATQIKQLEAKELGSGRSKADGSAVSGKVITIGVSLPGTDHSWLGAVKRNVETAGKDFEDVKLVITDGMNSSEKQTADIETLLQKKVDIIVMLPHSGKALTPAAKKIKQAGVPLVVIDREIESEDYYAFIGGDNYGIGQAAARYIGEKLKGKGNVVEVMGLAGISVTTDRHKGFVDTLKSEYPDINVLASLAADFSASKGMNVTEATLQAHPKIDAIYSHDDDMNVGVLRAVEQSGRKGILVTGAGGSKLMMQKIKSGKSPIKATFLYNPAMAGSAINLARLAALGKGMQNLWEPEIPRRVLIRASAVDQDNVEKFAHLGY